MPNLEDVFQDRDAYAYMTTAREHYGESLGDWQNRTEEADSLIRGEITRKNPDGNTVSVDMVVMNLAEQVPRDIQRLASEVEPSYSAPVLGDKVEDTTASLVHSAIGRSYFHYNDFDIIRPQLVMDLCVTGTMFMAIFMEEGFDYPRFMRLDPRTCFPDVYNGKLLDLLVVQKMRAKVAAAVFPDVDFGSLAGARGNRDVEVWDYYGQNFNAKALATTGEDRRPVKGTSVTPLAIWEHELGRVPVGFAQLPSADGSFRGIIDQVAPSLQAKNRAVGLILEYAHEGIYASWEEKGILNPTQKPGPDTIYHHNPNAQHETFMRRTEPANFNPQLLQLIGYLDQEERGQLGYPESRQGSISQERGSAAFVTATQGQLTSQVRETQRLLKRLQEEAASIAGDIDQFPELDYKKPMCRAVNDQYLYTPSKDLAGTLKIEIEYGAGAGLDRINTDTRLQNWYAAGLLSGETALNQTDFIPDGMTEMERRESEEIGRVILQRFGQDPSVSLDFIGAVWKYKRETGVSLADAYMFVSSQQAAQPELEGPAEEAAPGEEPDVGTQQPGETGLAPASPFSPPPRYQSLVMSGRGNSG